MATYELVKKDMDEFQDAVGSTALKVYTLSRSIREERCSFEGAARYYCSGSQLSRT